jgi:hypothetical protein
MIMADIQLSKNFKRSEFKCPCKGKYCNGYPVEPDKNLVNILQSYRDYVGKPVTIHALRCKKQNSIVGGASNSYHIKGLAADIQGLQTTKEKDKAMSFFKKQKNYKYTYTNNTNMKYAVHIEVYPYKATVTDIVPRDEDIDQIQVTKSKKLNVRVGAGSSYNSLGFAKYNGIYNLLEEKGDWIRIAESQWVNKNYVQILRKPVAKPIVEEEIIHEEELPKEETIETVEDMQKTLWQLMMEIIELLKKWFNK